MPEKETNSYDAEDIKVLKVSSSSFHKKVEWKYCSTRFKNIY